LTESEAGLKSPSTGVDNTNFELCLKVMISWRYQRY